MPTTMANLTATQKSIARQQEMIANLGYLPGMARRPQGIVRIPRGYVYGPSVRNRRMISG